VAQTRSPVVIGLLGGIASGKSFVARLLAEHGAEPIDADRLAQAALDEPAVAREVETLLGAGVLDEEGRPIRAAIADRVFADPQKLKALEALLHPQVARAIRARLDALRQGRDRPRAVCVLDVPLLVEAGLRPLCDELLFIEVADETRAARARTRGWDAGEIDRREARQLPIAKKRALATWTVSNDGERDATTAALAAFWRERVIPRRT